MRRASTVLLAAVACGDGAGPAAIGTARGAIRVEADFPGATQGRFGGRMIPDPSIAAGPTRLVEATNDSLTLLDKSGAVLDEVGLVAFFADLFPGAAMYDPMVVFDHHDGRFALVCGADRQGAGEAALMIAVSADAAPGDLGRGSWLRWRTEGAVDGGSPLCPEGVRSWPDFPRLGYGGDALVVGCNQYAFGDWSFCLGQVRVYDKAALLAGDEEPAYRDFRSWEWSNPIPSATHGRGEDVWAVADLGYDGDLVRVLRVRGGADPTVEDAVLPVPLYQRPPPAAQPGSAARVDAGDTRFLNTVWRRGVLWAAHAVRAGEVAAVRWYAIDTAGWPDPAIAQDGEYGAPDAWRFFPALAVDPAGTLVMFLNTSSATDPLAGAWTWRAPSDPPGTLHPPRVLVESPAPLLGGGVIRFGDFNGAWLDPDGERRVWGVVAIAREDGRWTTHVAAVDTTCPEGDAGCVPWPEAGFPERLDAGARADARRDERAPDGADPLADAAATAEAGPAADAGPAPLPRREIPDADVPAARPVAAARARAGCACAAGEGGSGPWPIAAALALACATAARSRRRRDRDHPRPALRPRTARARGRATLSSAA